MPMLSADELEREEINDALTRTSGELLSAIELAEERLRELEERREAVLDALITPYKGCRSAREAYWPSRPTGWCSRTTRWRNSSASSASA